MPGYLLNTDQYVLSLNAGIPNVKNLALLQNALRFAVEDTGAAGSHLSAKRAGVVRPKLGWSLERRMAEVGSSDVHDGLTAAGEVRS